MNNMQWMHVSLLSTLVTLMWLVFAD